MEFQKLEAFRNVQSVKDKDVNRVRKHMKLDNIIQGTGWNGKRGCAIGCIFEDYNHRRAPVEIGMPIWLAMVVDALHEGQDIEDAKKWPLKVLEAIKPGMDLEKVKAPLMIYTLELALPALKLVKYPDTLTTITDVIEYFRDNKTGPYSYEVAHPIISPIGISAVNVRNGSAEAVADVIRGAVSCSYLFNYPNTVGCESIYKVIANKLIEIIEDHKRGD